MDESWLSNIGNDVLETFEGVVAWFMNASTATLVGLGVVAVIVLILLSFVLSAANLAFKRWYIRGIIHTKQPKEKKPKGRGLVARLFGKKSGVDRDTWE